MAVGDVNRDDTPGIVTGAGALGNSWVQVYDGRVGASTAALNVFQAFPAAGDNSQTAVQVLLRDIDEDGKAGLPRWPCASSWPWRHELPSPDFLFP